MSDTPVLYIGDKNVSSWSMRPWVALTHKGVPFEERTISLPEDKDRAKRRAVGPTGKVPVLHHRGMRIPDSLAILEYLEETFPQPNYPALWPADAQQRAHARWLSATMHSGFPLVREHMSFNWCFVPTPPKPPAEAVAEAREMLGYWETALSAAPKGGPYLFGAFSGADAMFAPAVVRLSSFGISTDGFPRAAAYMPALLEAPAVRGWVEAARKLPPRETY
jgi:glutathione S-transferase